MKVPDLSPRRFRKAALSRLSRWQGRRLAGLPSGSAILVVTFDDVPRSAATTGAAILDRHGARATYFACGGIDPAAPGAPFATPQDLRTLARDGFEIGCHGFAHIDQQEAGAAGVAADLDRNAAFFAEHDLGVARTFAYPYGRTTPAAKALCAARFAIARGVQARVVQGRFDRALAPSVPLFADAVSRALAEAAIDRVGREGGALVLFSHAVTDDPGPYDCTPGHLSDTLRRAQAAGIEILTLEALARRAGCTAA